MISIFFSFLKLDEKTRYWCGTQLFGWDSAFWYCINVWVVDEPQPISWVPHQLLCYTFCKSRKVFVKNEFHGTQHARRMFLYAPVTTARCAPYYTLKISMERPWWLLEPAVWTRCCGQTMIPWSMGLCFSHGLQTFPDLVLNTRTCYKLR